MQSTNIFKISSQETYLNLNRAIVFKNSLSPFEQEQFSLLAKFKTFSSVINKEDNSINHWYQIPAHFKNPVTAIKNEGFDQESWQLLTFTNLSEYCFCLKNAKSNSKLGEKLIISFGKTIIFMDDQWTQFADEIHKSIVCSMLNEVKKLVEEISSMMLNRAMFDMDEDEEQEDIELYQKKNSMAVREKYNAINTMIFFFIPCMIGILVPGASFPVGVYFLTSWLFTHLNKKEDKNERQYTNRKNIKRLLGRD